MKKQTFTISIYSENNLGLLNRISIIFLKRHINIESVTASKSEIKEVTRLIVVVKTTEEQIKKIIGQIEKQIEVIKAYYHTDGEIIYLQSALFKIKSALLFDERQIQNIIKESNAQIVTVSPEFFVIEKSGRKEEIDTLYDKLVPFGIMQFVRSGRISISKEEMKISEILKAMVQS
jgi:acetolactate synthase-1/3 small subunit